MFMNENQKAQFMNHKKNLLLGITMKKMLVINIINTDEWESHETTAIIYKLLQITKFGVYLKIN